MFFDGKTRLICPLTCGTWQALRGEMLSPAAADADMIELRLDYLDALPTPSQLGDLLREAPRPVLVTCRPVGQGGRYGGDETARLQLLQAAWRTEGVLVDIEIGSFDERASHPSVILSHHDYKGIPADLGRIVARLEASGAGGEKLAFASRGPEDALLALEILRSCRKPAISLAMGEAGLASRILAKKFGALGTFASPRRGKESAPGQPTVEELKNIYRWDRIGPASAVYGVIGCPIAHSMSPAIHNAAFEAAGFDGVYVPLRVEPGMDNFRRFMDALLERPWLDWRGLSVTIPHKENALALVGPRNCDELSIRIGAINTITLADGKLHGDNTDFAASVEALCSAMLIERRDLAGRSVAVIGSGGSARALVAAMTFHGADVTIYNRTHARSEQLAGEFACKCRPLDQLPRTDAEILVNCTPIGMHPNVADSPIQEIPPTVRAVFDMIYNPIETRLLREAHASGCQTVSGLDMFVNQAAAQFETWTARPAPRQVMRQVVVRRLAGQL